MYDAEVGRWSAPDPLSEKFFYISLYNYTDNNPVNNIDPNGMEMLGANSFILYEEEAKAAFTLLKQAGQGAGREKEDKEEKKKKEEEKEEVTISGANKGGSPWTAALATTGILLADDATVIGAVDDIAIPIVLAGAAVYDVTQRVYVTYTLTGPKGQKYAGRTSGFGDPYSIMMSRFAFHHMKYVGYGNPVLDRAVQGPMGYLAIRGREQQLIDFYGGVGNSNVGNSIRGVGYYNPVGPGLHSLSNATFGPLAPYTGYYKQ